MSRTIPQDFSLSENDHPANVFTAYEHLRNTYPVAHTEDYGGYWALTRHEDVRTAAMDSDMFISSVKAVVPSDPRGIRRPPLNFDAPRHTPFRRALARTLSEGRVAEILEQLRPRAAALYSAFAAGEEPDIAKTFGTLLPAYAVSFWLNLDEERVEWLAETATAWVDAWRRQDAEEVSRRSEEMYEVARWLVEDRSARPQNPRHDPASSLLAEQSDGEPLETELIIGALRQSLVVGMVAPPLLIGSMAWHLSQDQNLHAALAADARLIPGAAEEFIRLYTPYRGFARTVSQTTEVRGVTIEPGEPVTLVYAAANRDPEVFKDPDRFLAGRPNISEHLGFGKGRHQCVGIHLARGIINVALETIVEKSSRLELDGTPVPTRMPELGYQTVPIRVLP
jgi:cytochrome P450